jgi:hypothetical protein
MLKSHAPNPRPGSPSLLVAPRETAEHEHATTLALCALYRRKDVSRLTDHEEAEGRVRRTDLGRRNDADISDECNGAVRRCLDSSMYDELSRKAKGKGISWKHDNEVGRLQPDECSSYARAAAGGDRPEIRINVALEHGSPAPSEHWRSSNRSSPGSGRCPDRASIARYSLHRTARPWPDRTRRTRAGSGPERNARFPCRGVSRTWPPTPPGPRHRTAGQKARARTTSWGCAMTCETLLSAPGEPRGGKDEVEADLHRERPGGTSSDIQEPTRVLHQHPDDPGPQGQDIQARRSVEVTSGSLSPVR